MARTTVYIVDNLRDLDVAPDGLEAEAGMADKLDRRVIVTDSESLLGPGIALLRERGVKVDVLPEGITGSEAAAIVAGYPAAIVGLMPFRSEEIAALRTTGLLVRAGIGYDIIDIDAATAAGIWVVNVPDYCVEEVADHAMLLLLSAWRHLGELEAVWHAGAWVAPALVPRVDRIRGRRLGIVGFGRIGRAVAQRARAFGFDVVAHDPYVADEVLVEAGVAPIGLDALIETSDAITLHCPMNAETAHLVNGERLAHVRPGVVLVNTSRGGLVDLDALDAAVGDGRVGAVGLDVVEDEPAPDLSRPLFARPNVRLTPHLAWYSIEARRDLALRAAEEADRFISGERPRNVVNLAARAAP